MNTYKVYPIEFDPPDYRCSCEDIIRCEDREKYEGKYKGRWFSRALEGIATTHERELWWTDVPPELKKREDIKMLIKSS